MKYPKTRKLNILVVNDNNFSILIISKALAKLNYISKLDTAINGQAAFDMIKEKFEKTAQHYDIVFLDLDMPILNGFEACSNIIAYYGLIKPITEKVSPNSEWLADLM